MFCQELANIHNVVSGLILQIEIPSQLHRSVKFHGSYYDDLPHLSHSIAFCIFAITFVKYHTSNYGSSRFKLKRLIIELLITRSVVPTKINLLLIVLHEL